MGLWIGLFLGLLAISSSVLALPAVLQPIYEDVLAPGWQDWSWGNRQIDFQNVDPVYGGNTSVLVTLIDGWSGFMLGAPAGIVVSDYQSIRFAIHGGASGGQNLLFRVGNQDAGAYVEQPVVPVAGVWSEIEISLGSLGVDSIDYVWWFNNAGGPQATFYIDDVVLYGSSTPPPTPEPGDGPDLVVNAAANRHPISPEIYGLNFASQSLAQELNLSVNRWGGNATTRYNWQFDISNRASDWYFENIPNSDGSGLPDNAASNQFIEANQNTGTETVLTVPLIGWTPKNSPNILCGFSVSKYGPQQSTDPWQPDCGNGIRPDGTEITGNDPTDTSLAIDHSFIQSWVEYLVNRYGTGAQGGVRYYNLDNEPMLWPDTHRDVHPEPTSYDEVRDRTYAYAAGIKQADPTSKTLGPAVWGWTAYFYSALDWSAGGQWWNNPQDRLAHGDVPFLPWYLQQMAQYEADHNLRILDYLDIHYYPQSGVALTGAGNAALQALRLRSTRSLWDPTYVDESWIGEPVQLIPRMQDWIDTYYPATQLAITEYNWGALDHINGALAQADVLGIFGREGVDLATLWAPPEANQPGAFAFRMYRNYDGAGGRFGETSIQATSSDQDQLAIYAAERLLDGALTVVVINKIGQALTSHLTLHNFSTSHANGYRYSTENLDAIETLTPAAVLPSGLNATYPPNSLTLWVFPAEALTNWHIVHLPVVIQ